MATVRIPAPLRKLTNNQEEVLVAGTSLKAILDELNRIHPGFHERLLDESGAVRRFVNIFLNDEDVRFLQDQETPVKETDVISIVPATAGG
jgi:molybdopterin synthase sulfur carrier subunit